MIAAGKKSVAEQQEQTARPLLYRFNGFVNICLAQLKEHQSIINPVLWRYYSDEELNYMSAAFTISQSVSARSKLSAA